jgi:ABC-type cobalamin/Fe3+-siderophores transport system ATPase subunit
MLSAVSISRVLCQSTNSLALDHPFRQFEYGIWKPRVADSNPQTVDGASEPEQALDINCGPEASKNMSKNSVNSRMTPIYALHDAL